jgi:hypothetical protein
VTCSEGNESVLCGICAKTFVNTITGQCIKCDYSQGGVQIRELALAIELVTLVGVVVCVTRISRVRAVLTKYDKQFREKMDPLASKLKIITAYFSQSCFLSGASTK